MSAAHQEQASGQSLPLTVPERIRQRLACEGICTVADWLRLGEARFKIFGVTAAVVRQIDVLAEAAR